MLPLRKILIAITIVSFTTACTYMHETYDAACVSLQEAYDTVRGSPKKPLQREGVVDAPMKTGQKIAEWDTPIPEGERENVKREMIGYLKQNRLWDLLTANERNEVIEILDKAKTIRETFPAFGVYSIHQCESELGRPLTKAERKKAYETWMNPEATIDPLIELVNTLAGHKQPKSKTRPNRIIAKLFNEMDQSREREVLEGEKSSLEELTENQLAELLDQEKLIKDSMSAEFELDKVLSKKEHEEFKKTIIDHLKDCGIWASLDIKQKSQMVAILDKAKTRREMSAMALQFAPVCVYENKISKVIGQKFKQELSEGMQASEEDSATLEHEPDAAEESSFWNKATNWFSSL